MKYCYWKKTRGICTLLLTTITLSIFTLSPFLSNTCSAETVSYSVSHTFSIADVQGGFDGTTYGGIEGSIHDPEIICGLNDVPCPDSVEPFTDTSGTTLYPVDSEFGFYNADFVGAAQKFRDNDYAEGWVGNIITNGVITGIAVSNAPTDTFKVKAPMGTWCAGLGGNMVKCSTEHFAVLEHIKTCYETVPYHFYDFTNNKQGDLYDPETIIFGDPQVIGSCANGQLDNSLYIVTNGVVDESSPLQMDDYGFPNLIANESSVRKDIAVGRDYSITKKDDGKVLYRFGSMIKRPNDIRLYARMPLPDEWKANPETNYSVSRAELHVDHLITNNPNDQLRPEDMENEGATGRKPGYQIEIDGTWISDRDCYEGDGDFIPAGTIFKHPAFSVSTDANSPIPFSEDLQEGYTNAWYTTTDRDPFESDPVTNIGPRWRLKANKFGQDLPGLELPSVECMPTPYTSKFKKYEVGELTTTIINLLNAEGESPLLHSDGWRGTLGNGVNVIASDDDGQPIPGLTVNGLPITDDFDLAVYIKGDRKPTAVYSATLLIEYEGQTTDTSPIVEDFDFSIDSFRAPKKIFEGTTKNIKTYISNYGPDVANGTLVLKAVFSDWEEIIETDIGAVAPGETVKIVTPWTAPDDTASTVNWTATLFAEGDTDLSNNVATGTSLIRVSK